jgi:exodeoxyribonuclease X
MRRIVFGDCETTGVTPSDKMVEIAFAVYDNNLNFISADESLIDPEMPIPSGASAVHHITNAAVENEPTLEQFMQMRGNPLKFGGRTLFIAHNASFDIRYFAPHMDEDVETLCTLRLAKKLFPGLDSYKLQALKYSLGLGDVEGDAHRAGADVELLVKLVFHMMEGSGLDIEGLVALSKAPLNIETMPFGKHKGKALADVPIDYFQWLMKQDNVDPDLVASIRKVHPNI